jgi:hypothetical protein
MLPFPCPYPLTYASPTYCSDVATGPLLYFTISSLLNILNARFVTFPSSFSCDSRFESGPIEGTRTKLARRHLASSRRLGRLLVSTLALAFPGLFLLLSGGGFTLPL